MIRLILLIIFTSHFAAAAECNYLPNKSIGKIKNEPKYFSNTTNNLVRRAGSPYEAEGTKITIKGKLLDTYCVPIPNASIKIWQPDTNGHYVKEAPSNVIVTKEFLGSGITYTNNLGEFNFVTILPGGDSLNPPHINVKIKHDDIDDFYNKIVFSDESNPKGNLIVARKNPNEPVENEIYYVDITLGLVDSYKRY